MQVFTNAVADDVERFYLAQQTPQVITGTRFRQIELHIEPTRLLPTGR